MTVVLKRWWWVALIFAAIAVVVIDHQILRSNRATSTLGPIDDKREVTRKASREEVLLERKWSATPAGVVAEIDGAYPAQSGVFAAVKLRGLPIDNTAENPSLNFSVYLVDRWGRLYEPSIPAMRARAVSGPSTKYVFEILPSALSRSKILIKDTRSNNKISIQSGY